MRQILALFAVAAFALTASAQQTNTAFAALAIDSPTSSVVGTGPTSAPVFTDSNINVNVQGWPLSPMVLMVGFLQVNSIVAPFGTIDLQPTSGNITNNIIVNGWTDPSTQTYTNATGGWTSGFTVPACTTNAMGLLTCNNPNTFSYSTQAVVTDITNMPFGVRPTGAATANFTDGYTQFTIGSDQSATYTFINGMSFPYYNNTYTSCYVSDNGFVSFGAQDNGFPSPTVGGVQSGVPRVMVFYNDLVTGLSGGYNYRIYAQAFTEAGTRKVRIGHERLAEFANATGPHGGEMVLSENGDITVLVHAYNAAPSINTVVGITPGGNLGSGSNTTAFGRDLSVDASGVTILGVNDNGYELFNHGSTPTTNPLDLAGFQIGVGGIQYFKTPGVASYTIQ